MFEIDPVHDNKLKRGSQGTGAAPAERRPDPWQQIPFSAGLVREVRRAVPPLNVVKCD